MSETIIIISDVIIVNRLPVDIVCFNRHNNNNRKINKINM